MQTVIRLNKCGFSVIFLSNRVAGSGPDFAKKEANQTNACRFLYKEDLQDKLSIPSKIWSVIKLDPLMKPHPSRTVTVPAHLCGHCNGARPHLYECRKCSLFFTNSIIDKHEELCGKSSIDMKAAGYILYKV